jgi:nicotinic acid phosphoribosyltransferase
MVPGTHSELLAERQMTYLQHLTTLWSSEFGPGTELFAAYARDTVGDVADTYEGYVMGLISVHSCWEQFIPSTCRRSESE